VSLQHALIFLRFTFFRTAIFPSNLSVPGAAMKLFSTSNAGTSARDWRGCAHSGRGQVRWLARPILLGAVTIAALLVCASQATVASANTEPAAGIGYLCVTLVLLLCAVAFWTRARLATGSLKLRWAMIAAAALIAGVGYFPSFAEFILHTEPARQLQTACFNASEALYMLALVLFFARVQRSIVIVDMIQALLFIVLRFNLIYSPTAPDHFTANHLLIGQIVALCLFLIALVACFGATTRSELTFLHTLSWFFGLRLIAFFLSNQVAYTWLHDLNSSAWDVPGNVLLAGFALYVLYTQPVAEAAAVKAAPVRTPSFTVLSLMPSFLALANLMLGLMLLRTSLVLVAIAVSVSLVCYVARTVMLQVQSAKETAYLHSRNEQLEDLAICDPLTGVGNRRSLTRVYSQIQSASDDEGLSLLLIDIDFFKQANDSYGHLHGDRVLVTLAMKLERLAAQLPGSHCARFGGDEFALLLPGTSLSEASLHAEELRDAFMAHTFDAHCSGISLSIGVAGLKAAGDLPLEALISYADQALYRAKLLGRNRVELQPVWEPGGAAENLAIRMPQMELQQIA
jgi:diguanylate cyclase (GGDEF)-like protein